MRHSFFYAARLALGFSSDMLVHLRMRSLEHESLVSAQRVHVRDALRERLHGNVGDVGVVLACPVVADDHDAPRRDVEATLRPA